MQAMCVMQATGVAFLTSGTLQWNAVARVAVLLVSQSVKAQNQPVIPVAT